MLTSFSLTFYVEQMFVAHTLSLFLFLGCHFVLTSYLLDLLNKRYINTMSVTGKTDYFCVDIVISEVVDKLLVGCCSIFAHRSAICFWKPTDYNDL